MNVMKMLLAIAFLVMSGIAAKDPVWVDGTVVSIMQVKASYTEMPRLEYAIQVEHTEYTIMDGGNNVFARIPKAILAVGDHARVAVHGSQMEIELPSGKVTTKRITKASEK
jgi:hypothetical protein